ncbi:hypothetical protein HY213_02325, partial [Candidatus Peregrinibacteria bacterium]|nr:hypothetical protein [Candidatus Peregrinibacteria bacterium]
MPEKNPRPSAASVPPRAAGRAGGKPNFFGMLRRYLGLFPLRGTTEPSPTPSLRSNGSPKKPKVVLVKKLRLAIPERTRAVPMVFRPKKITVRTVKKILLPPTSQNIPSPKIEDIAAMEQSLQQYMERKSVARQQPRVPPVPVREPPSALPDDEAVLSGWRKFLRFLPFLSATLLETKQKTQTLEQKLAEHERRTREMALRLHEAELRLQERAQQEERRETLQRSSTVLSSPNTAGTGRVSSPSSISSPHGSIRGPSTAPSRSAPSENDQETAGAGRLLAAEKRQETPTETLKAGDLAGLKRAAKDTSTFGLVEKEKRGILGSLFSGIRE